LHIEETTSAGGREGKVGASLKRHLKNDLLGNCFVAALKLDATDSFPKEVDQLSVHFRVVYPLQCGPSFTTNKRALSIRLAVRKPEAPIRYNPPRIAVDNKYGLGDTGQVLAEILIQCRDSSKAGDYEWSHTTMDGHRGNLLEESQLERGTAALKICPAISLGILIYPLTSKGCDSA
jgi:hypothetical protein